MSSGFLREYRLRGHGEYCGRHCHARIHRYLQQALLVLHVTGLGQGGGLTARTSIHRQHQVGVLVNLPASWTMEGGRRWREGEGERRGRGKGKGKGDERQDSHSVPGMMMADRDEAAQDGTRGGQRRGGGLFGWLSRLKRPMEM